jgi:hypothetical protein
MNKRIIDFEIERNPDDNDYFFIDSTQKGSKRISFMNLSSLKYRRILTLPTYDFDWNTVYLIRNSNPTEYHNYDKYMLIPEDIVGESVIAYDVTGKIDLEDVEWQEGYEYRLGTIQAYNTTWYVEYIQYDEEITDNNTIYFNNDDVVKCYYKKGVKPTDTNADLASLIGSWELL